MKKFILCNFILLNEINDAISVSSEKIIASVCTALMTLNNDITLWWLIWTLKRSAEMIYVISFRKFTFIWNLIFTHEISERMKKVIDSIHSSKKSVHSNLISLNEINNAISVSSEKIIESAYTALMILNNELNFIHFIIYIYEHI